MTSERPRGIAVTDVGYTNTKIVLFDAAGHPVAERKVASHHVEGPPYRHIDPAPLVEFLRQTLQELDRLLPVDVIVPSAHGAAMALLAGDGNLALPVMDYTAEPPPEIVAAYSRVMPDFAEARCPLLPMALTHGLQMYWQQHLLPGDFARVTTAIPWIQYVGFLLCGRAVTEITAMSCQTQLTNIATGSLSSLVRSQGWQDLFPPMVRSWEVIGQLLPAFRGAGFRGLGRVLAGIHDSSANYVRYLSAGLKAFTLLSTGTWIIAFDSAAPPEMLREDYDMATNTDIFGRPVAVARFFGGKEFEALAGKAADAPPALASAAALVERGVMALPSFTASPGPKPGTDNRGRIVGAVANDTELVSLASLYCALMVSAQLDVLQSKGDVIVDGPFAQNPVFLAVLAELRGGQRVLASDLRDGTTAGAACLALMEDGALPRIALDLLPVAPAGITGLADYQRKWNDLSRANRS
jgi:sugar (pentulose or hexulose) kinase